MKKFKIITFIFLFLLTFSLFNISNANEDLNIYSPSVILIENSSGKIIYEKNAYEKMYPASTTKIMTAILTLEYCNLTDTAIVSANAVNSIPYSYTTAYLQIGEELTINQLLHVLLIPSANDAAVVLAEHVAGSVESFATMMNSKAAEIGCLNTNFVNPNGIHNENHYTTAYDLALIAKYAMQNETFRQIVSTREYTLPATNKWLENDRYFKNTNQLLLPDTRDSIDNYYNEYCIGIKTGYTSPAKECIVASVKKDDLEFIAVVLGSDKTENGLSQRYLDCNTLFNYALENYSLHQVHAANSVLKQIDISNATRNTRTLDIIVQDEINVLANKSTDITSISPQIDFSFDLKAPIKKDSVIGKVTYTIDGTSYSSNLLAGSDVEKSNFSSLLLDLLILIIVLFIFYKVMENKNKRKRIRRSRRR